jgi:hypothetical protein
VGNRFLRHHVQRSVTPTSEASRAPAAPRRWEYDARVTARTRRTPGILAGAALLGAAAAVYWSVVRPWHLRWGATPEEVARRWPGDELVERPLTRAVRAVTIAAPPARIWPWIMQVGRDRGGFYSYTWLENLIGADIHNVERLIPGLPDREPGDTVWMGPEDRFGGQARMVVASVVPGRAMALVMLPDAERVRAGGRAQLGAWAFALEPAGADATRLVMLSLGPETMTPGRLVLERGFWEPAHFVMERRMMLTLKRLAEAHAMR